MKKLYAAALFMSGSLWVMFVLSGCTPKPTATLWSPSMPDSIFYGGPVIDPDVLAHTIHTYTNDLRKRNGQNELAWSNSLAQIARNHSVDMSQNAYFGHINPRGESATERAKRLGYSTVQRNNQFVVTGLGENLFATHRYRQYVVNRDLGLTTYEVDWKTPEDVARDAVDAWMNSVAHRKNLLSAIYTQEGIGVHIGANGTIFITQNFN